MLIRVALLVLGLGLFFACDDEGDDKPADNNPADGKPALAFIHDDGVADDGKGKIEVQLNKGDKAVTDAAGTEVVLTIACGSNSEEFKGELDKRGWAEIEVDVSDKKDDWKVTDWSECKVSAVANIDGEEIEAKEVELKTVGQEQGTCEKEGGCDDDDLDTYEIGEEIGIQASLGGGQLSLHNCTAATLYTVDSDSAVNVAANNSVTADTTTKSFPTMFVLGTAGDKCMLQHTPTGGTAADHAKIEPASTPENIEAAELDVVLTKTSDYKLNITLPAKPTNDLSDTVTVYASGDSGMTWQEKEQNAAWGTDFESSTRWEGMLPYAHYALLRISFKGASNSNKAAYWSLHQPSHNIKVSGITIGQVFTISGVPASIDYIYLRVVEGCGLHFFTIKKSSIANATHDTPDERSLGSYRAIAPENNIPFKVLAIDKQGEAGYTAGCNVKLNVGGVILVVSTKEDSTRPQFTGITVDKYSDSGTDKIAVTLPAWDSNKHGTKGDSFYSVLRDADSDWHDQGAATWGSTNNSTAGWFSDPTTHNQMLVSVVLGSKTWWHYAEHTPPLPSPFR